MSVYGGVINSSFIQNESSILPDISVDSLMLDESVSPCFEDNFITAAARVNAECTINMNNILEACAIEEFCYLEATGTEMVYEEGRVAGFIEKAKQFFLKLWEKIKSIFKKAIMMFDQHAKSDKEFFNKYKKDLNKAGNSGFGDKEISIFNYVWYGSKKTDKSLDATWNIRINSSHTMKDLNEVDTAMQIVESLSNATNIVRDITTLSNASDSEDKNDLIKTIEESIKKVNESDWKTDTYDNLRAAIIKEVAGTDNYKDNSCDSGSFSKDFKEALQGGDTSKDNVALGTALDRAKLFLDGSSKNYKVEFDAQLKNWKKDIDKSVKSLEQQQKTFTKTQSNSVTNNTRALNFKHTMLANAIQVMQNAKTIGVTAHSIIIQCLKACSAQSRSICVQAINYKKPKNESGLFVEESGSLLSNVELI